MNCIIFVIKLLDDVYGIEFGIVMMIYFVMNDQQVIDVYYFDLWCMCVVSQLIILVDIKLVVGIMCIFLQFNDCFEVIVVCVLIINVMVIDLSVMVKKLVKVSEVNQLL